MRNRLTVTLGLFSIATMAPVFGQTPAKPSPAAKQAPGKAIPRTPDGHPDLQGTWNFATLTTLQRPPEFANKPTLTDAEARAYERKDLSENTLDSSVDSAFNKQTGGPGVGAYNNVFVDRGSQLARVDGVKRTSLVVDPPDGRIPELTPEAKQRNAARVRMGNSFDSVLDRPLSERCIIGFGSTAGPPMLPVLYNNLHQIVQTPDAVMIMSEMVHEVRIIRMNATHAPATVRQWLGDSIGHWEGDTLVVDTVNFTDKTRFQGASPNLHVIERFQRADANTILYRATVDDPATFTKPWTLEFPFVATKEPVYEYACAEGNYALTDILNGARKQDEEAAK